MNEKLFLKLGSNMENVRKLMDLYLLRIERKIKSIMQEFNNNLEEAALGLVGQFELLASYISVADNRIIVQQVVDGLMENLLHLKSKLIESAYVLNIFRMAEMYECMIRDGARSPTSANKSR